MRYFSDVSPKGRANMILIFEMTSLAPSLQIRRHKTWYELVDWFLQSFSITPKSGSLSNLLWWIELIPHFD